MRLDSDAFRIQGQGSESGCHDLKPDMRDQGPVYSSIYAISDYLVFPGVLGDLGAFVLGFLVLTLHPFCLLHASLGKKTAPRGAF